MSSNAIKVDNSKPNQHKPNIISEPNSSARDNMVLSKQLQALQGQTNSKKLATEKPETEKKKK